MLEIEIPFPFSDLPIKPELTGKVRVSNDITQTLATLMGWDGQSRRMLRASQSGALHAVAPQAKGIKTYTGVGGGHAFALDNMETTEVLIQAGKANAGYVRFSIGEAVGAANYYELYTEDTFTLAVDNTNRINVLVQTSGEKVLVVYSK